MLIGVTKAGNLINLNNGFERPRQPYFGSLEQWLLLGALALVCFGVMFLMRKKPVVVRDWVKIALVWVIVWQIDWLCFYVLYAGRGWDRLQVWIVVSVVTGAIWTVGARWLKQVIDPKKDIFNMTGKRRHEEDDDWPW